jgi:peptide methionine sulfoxide reductase msrA/msrB
MSYLKRYHSLTPFQHSIIACSCTQAPGSGSYENCIGEGIYLCYRCDMPLYLSSHQFSSGCGWPSFDDQLPGAVSCLPDPDGKRVEIQCSACKGHLGHVFQNEGFTPKMLRHCVNSASLRFIATHTSKGIENAYFAGGCFWGLQYLFDKLEGVVSTEVGYMGGQVVDPTYEEVCTGRTGHAEVVHVCFDNRKIDFNTLAKFFFECHDPFDKGGQGPDRGSQYCSVIFYMSQNQQRVADELKRYLSNKQEVATEVLPARLFYKAETYHQGYYNRRGGEPYCHRRVQRF